MNNKKLEWQYLVPDTAKFADMFNKKYPHLISPLTELQQRLMNCLKQLCHTRSPSRFLLIKAKEEEEYFKLIAETIKSIIPAHSKPIGGKYTITSVRIINWQQASTLEDNFAAKDVCTWQAWVEQEQLFGSLYCYKESINLQPGLVHYVNGGILLLGANTLVSQPLLWLRIKQMIIQQRFDWLPAKENIPLSIYIPSMPLNLRLIIIGDNEVLAALHTMEPDLLRLALYGEFELDKRINNAKDIAQWCSWVNTLAHRQGLQALHSDAWPELIKQSVRYSGDQLKLPLCPHWLTRRLKESVLYCYNKVINATALYESYRTNIWCESYICESMQQDIAEGQIMVDTESKITGQVNALSVLSFSGHPLLFGQPSRISCVVHFGDGEIHDVDSKAELSGNLHTKGMMIMQAFLMSVLKLDRQLPFSASLVFEQSYEEIDGDSASLAELVALISALADQPVDQQIAITGSVDQFGRVQSIGSINEKIEGFFTLCNTRGLTGNQGVIIPHTNIRHLCLNDHVIQEVRNNNFSIWPVNNIYDTLEILTAMPFSNEKRPNLIDCIRERIIKIQNRQERQYLLPFGLRWLAKRVFY
ncbi:AAA family ATPase [Candidatus Palibaumannia cicadellinicola]|uniref:endopeptidase La n=1 Tax=Candidatus Palibaumannia cicadellinicola TaxID=186490 RepID=A0A0K2BLM0_9GAMM|nr:Lon protease family protein [Candidatus Baumannia cicadellinicola]AKZ65953.1 Putative protease La-like protein [Candidatus Baumannia cicadellinicola]